MWHGLPYHKVLLASRVISFHWLRTSSWPKSNVALGTEALISINIYSTCMRYTVNSIILDIGEDCSTYFIPPQRLGVTPVAFTLPYIQNLLFTTHEKDVSPSGSAQRGQGHTSAARSRTLGRYSSTSSTDSGRPRGLFPISQFPV